MWMMMLLLALLLGIAGCAKKQAAAPPPAPPPPPPAPTATITANPSSVERGASTRLTWSTENATDVSIDGVGKVEASGSKDVSPSNSTSYHLVAKGPGGEQDAIARVTVTQPPPPPVSEAPPSLSDEQWLNRNVKDVYFDYDSAAVRADAQSAIAANVRALQEKPSLRVTIEGHADERGSTEYNLTLGDERANAVKNALISAGVSPSRINTISYGKEKPVCTEATEGCWQQNRRGHFALK